MAVFPPERIVLDTNVLVAAAFAPHSAAGAIAGAARAGSVVLVWNRATLAEARRILERIPPLRGHPWRAMFRAGRRIEGVRAASGLTMIADFSDRKFAALAAAADADLISQDRHLLEVRDMLPCRIHTPGEYVRRLR